MKVLLWGRPDDGIIGGDLLQIRKTAEVMGWEHSFKYGLDDDYLGQFDIIHLFLLFLPTTSVRINQCNKLGKRLVLSPIYRDPTQNE